MVGGRISTTHCPRCAGCNLNSLDIQRGKTVAYHLNRPAAPVTKVTQVMKAAVTDFKGAIQCVLR